MYRAVKRVDKYASFLICSKEQSSIYYRIVTAQGTSVNPKKVMELRLDRVDIDITSIESKELLPFQIYCRREKTENRY